MKLGGTLRVFHRRIFPCNSMVIYPVAELIARDRLSGRDHVGANRFIEPAWSLSSIPDRRGFREDRRHQGARELDWQPPKQVPGYAKGRRSAFLGESGYRRQKQGHLEFGMSFYRPERQR